MRDRILPTREVRLRWLQVGAASCGAAHSARAEGGFPAGPGTSPCAAPSDLTGADRESFPAAAADGDPLGPTARPAPLGPCPDCAARGGGMPRGQQPRDGNELCPFPSPGGCPRRGGFKGGSGVDGARLAPTTWLRSSESPLKRVPGSVSSKTNRTLALFLFGVGPVREP